MDNDGYESVKLDRSKWPYNYLLTSEPDSKQWEDEATGLACRVYRQTWSGILCGYVGLDKEHPWFGLDYSAEVCSQRMPDETPVQKVGIVNAIPIAAREKEGLEKYSIDSFLVAHGGITFSEKFKGSEKWWFGFDCNHGGDFLPAVKLLQNPNNYRDFEYVEANVANLAKQLSEVKSNNE